MKRNFKKDYLKKLVNTEINGYKFDLANYLHNPHCEYDYPSFEKIINSDDEYIKVERIYYFKYYDGSGQYLKKVYKIPNNNNNWNVIYTLSDKILEESNRFNLNKLLSFCK